MTPQNSQFLFSLVIQITGADWLGCFELGNKGVKGRRENTAPVGSTISILCIPVQNLCPTHQKKEKRKRNLATACIGKLNETWNIPALVIWEQIHNSLENKWGINRSVVFFNFICHFRDHSESEESLSLPRKRTQIAMNIDFGCEEGWAMLFIINCISLVASNSSSHGSNLSIINVSKRVRALRHPHLRRQFSTGEKRNWGCYSELCDGLSRDHAQHVSELFLSRGPCHAAQFPAAWRRIWALWDLYGYICLLTRGEQAVPEAAALRLGKPMVSESWWILRSRREGKFGSSRVQSLPEFKGLSSKIFQPNL